MKISRRRFLAVSSASAALAAVPFQRFALAQAPPASPPVTKFEVIRRNVGYFTGRGGTIGWLSHKDALLVVDTQFPDTAKLCLDGLRTRAGRVPDIVFNTHHHGDHTGGNGVFRPVVKRIVAHARVPELQKRQAAQQSAPNAAPPVVPDTTFDSTWSETLGDEQVRARHYGPAHTGGDAILVFERAQVVHLGDLLFHQMHPYIDRPSGASIQNWMKTLETIAKEMPAETIYIGGHAKPGEPVILARKDLLALRDYFDAALAHVQKGIKAGQSREEIASGSLPGFEQYHSSPPRLTLASTLGVAYDELTATP
jgi:glyoxylase-like metal-dependent hydrolase (beta-lactamase superfamily II)